MNSREIFQKVSAESAQTQQAWWIEILTTTPRCCYYFGPFESMAVAEQLQPGFIEDLVQEGAVGIAVQIQQDQPQDLTIDENEQP